MRWMHDQNISPSSQTHLASIGGDCCAAEQRQRLRVRITKSQAVKKHFAHPLLFFSAQKLFDVLAIRHGLSFPTITCRICHLSLAGSSTTRSASTRRLYCTAVSRSRWAFVTGGAIFVQTHLFLNAEISSGARLGVDHPGPGAGSTGPPRRRGVVQTESARNRLKRTLRGSDRRSAEVGSGVDQWTTPRRIFLLGGWTEGRRPTTPQRGSCGG